TLENIYANIDEISGKKLKENLLTFKEDVFLSKELVTINCHSPIEITLNDLQYKGYDADKVHALFQDLGFNSLIERIHMSGKMKNEPLKDIKYTVVNKVTSDMFTGEEALFLEMIDDNYHEAPIEAFGIVNRENRYFIPTNVALKSKVFKDWAEDHTNDKSVFD